MRNKLLTKKKGANVEYKSVKAQNFIFGQLLLKFKFIEKLHQMAMFFVFLNKQMKVLYFVILNKIILKTCLRWIHPYNIKHFEAYNMFFFFLLQVCGVFKVLIICY